MTRRNAASAALTISFAITASAALAEPGASTASSKPEASRPLILLLNGLGVYVENDYIGVSALARPLQQQGFRTLTDTHLMNRTGGTVPDIIIGHSMGGETALRYARRLQSSGKPPPLVITIDAAPSPPPCRVPRCINIHGPGFANVAGATNIDAWALGARFVNHAQLPTAPAVRSAILEQTQAFLNERKTPAIAESVAPPASAAPSAGGTARNGPQMWSLPGWTLPEWKSPSLWRNGG